MAKDISLLGATYYGVTGVALPLDGGGTANFTDVSSTTATDSDVASGKVYFKADGTQSTGTASGGGGGGASNVVTGTFTTGEAKSIGSVSLSYSGSGYPIELTIFVDGCFREPTWYSTLQRYTMGIWVMEKNYATEPTYIGSGDENSAQVLFLRKSSSTNAATVGANTAFSNVYSTTNASDGTATCVRLQNGSISYYVGHYNSTSDYSNGFMPNTTYRYVIVYSS